MRVHKDCLSWDVLCANQDMSDAFIVEMADYIDFDVLFLLKGASYPIIRRFLSKSTIRRFDQLKEGNWNEEERIELKRLLQFASLFHS